MVRAARQKARTGRGPEDSKGKGAARLVVLERGPVEEPDRERADRHDAEEDQRERDVRRTLGIVLREAIHLTGGAHVLPTPDLLSGLHEAEFWRDHAGNTSEIGCTESVAHDPIPERIELEHAAIGSVRRQMGQAVWTGSISFGLVSIPVKLYPAIEPKDV